MGESSILFSRCINFEKKKKLSYPVKHSGMASRKSHCHWSVNRRKGESSSTMMQLTKDTTFFEGGKDNNDGRDSGKEHMSRSPEEGANQGTIAESREEDMLLSLLKMKDLVADHNLRKRKNEKCYVDQIKQAKNYLRETMGSKGEEDFTGTFPCASEYNGFCQLLDAGLTFSHVNVVSGVMIYTFKCLRHAECLGEAYVLTTDKSQYSEILTKGHLCIARKEPVFEEVNSVVKRYQWTFFDNCYSARSGRNRAIAMGYRYLNSSTSAKRYVRNFVCSMKKRCMSRLRVVHCRGTNNTWIEFNSTYHEKNCLFYRPWEWETEDNATRRIGGNGNNLTSHGTEKSSTHDTGIDRPSQMMRQNQVVFYNRPVIPTNGKTFPQQDLRSSASHLHARYNWGNNNDAMVLVQHPGGAGGACHRGAATQKNVILVPTSLNRQGDRVANGYYEVDPRNGRGPPNQVRPLHLPGQYLATRSHRGALLNGRNAPANVFPQSGQFQREEGTVRKHGTRGTTGMRRTDIAVGGTRLLPLSKENPPMCGNNIQREVNPSRRKRASSGVVRGKQRSTRIRAQKKKTIIEDQGVSKERSANCTSGKPPSRRSRRGRGAILKPLNT
ncbi:Uncharacterized protein PCOAH_00011320 [Plasmodium coatneyi]|uniref:Uncharacterized protein n=1 Tax=Plasmodium coatneyi TaxID=208452 RepID=A0A1B1DVA1_9APIC|nr:Uncharacterized protein PCOAH_00011320 [Plasmodium coatneyi]ANQ06721.1 Uncharacterized protein PCOAH_00011320 [Plasmodium coatneyi]